MSYINPIAENWRRFQAELFPEIESDIGILLKTHRFLILALEMTCPERFIRRVHGGEGRPRLTGLIWRGHFWQNQYVILLPRGL